MSFSFHKLLIKFIYFKFLKGKNAFNKYSWKVHELIIFSPAAATVAEYITATLLTGATPGSDTYLASACKMVISSPGGRRCSL